MKNDDQAAPNLSLVDIVAFPYQRSPAHVPRVPRETLLACIEEALRILDDEFDSDELSTTSLTSRKQEFQGGSKPEEARQ